MKGSKLVAEAWLDISKLESISPESYAAIIAKEIMEVSVGVFNDELEEEGEWNGESYTAIASNHRPDHLALLPTQVGACSTEDGCGIRANSKSKTEGEENDMLNVNKENVHEVMEGILSSPETLNAYILFKHNVANLTVYSSLLVVLSFSSNSTVFLLLSDERMSKS
jgi:hypothetical protein